MLCGISDDILEESLDFGTPIIVRWSRQLYKDEILSWFTSYSQVLHCFNNYIIAPGTKRSLGQQILHPSARLSI